MSGGPVTGAIVALGGSLVGLVATTAGWAFAATTTTDIGPWAQVGGTATAVGALAYVAKLLADGKLVARPVAELERKAAEREQKIEEMHRDATQRLEQLLVDSKEREDSLRLMLVQRGVK